MQGASRVAIGVLAAALLVACSSGSSSKTPTTTHPLAPEDTATAKLTLAGDKGLSGDVGDASVNCSYPTLAGLRINAFGQAPDSNVRATVTLSADTVLVRVSTGARQGYHERDFTGSGVTGFDAARGAQIDAKLRETNGAPGTTPGTLGALTSIKGDVDCGSQRPGTSTIEVSGPSGDGVLSGKLDPVRVQCFASADGSDNFVVVRGIAKVGAKRAEVFVNGQPAKFIAGVRVAGGRDRTFASDVYATSLPTDTGLHVKGDAVESDGLGTTNTLHVEGDAVCGNAPVK